MIEVINDIQSHTKNYLKILEQDPNHRFRSWEHCYNFFKDKEQFHKDSDTGRMACLNLGFYLASRGMYSGLNGLLWKDYHAYSGIIQILMDPDYSSLWGIGINQLTHNNSLIDDIFKLSDRLAGEIKSIPYQKSVLDQPDYISATDALVTKIIFATMGCVPSYDTQFKKGCAEADVSLSNTFDKESFLAIMGFYVENNTAFQHASFEISNNRSMEYPDMKVIDIYFRQLAGD